MLPVISLEMIMEAVIVLSLFKVWDAGRTLYANDLVAECQYRIEDLSLTQCPENAIYRASTA
jgi:hypothetical protein